MERVSLDDVVFPPPSVVRIKWSDVDLSTNLTKRISLKTPLVSSPMDKVTEADMAILLARLGSIGVIHDNLSIEKQVIEIEKVRRWEAGFILKPVVLSQGARIKDVAKAAEENGFCTYPITEDGTLSSQFLGIVTRRDVRYQEDMEKSVLNIMTSWRMTKEKRKKIVVARKEDTLDKNDIRQANKIMRENNLDTLPIVDKEGRLVALVTDSDLAKNDKNEYATKDDNKQLKVLAAIEPRFERFVMDRISSVYQAGACGIVLDQRNVSEDQLKLAKWTFETYPDLDIILGNVVSKSAAREILDSSGKFIAALRCGIGGGAVCSTTEDLALGETLPSAVENVKGVVDEYKKRLGKVGVIADGGIHKPGHILVVMKFGADAAMIGTLFAGLDESPGEPQWSEEHGMMIKRVRGMGSAAVIKEKAGAARYMVDLAGAEEKFPEGIEKVVAYRGSGYKFIKKFLNGVRSGMHGLNCKNFHELRTRAQVVPRRTASSKGAI